MKFEEELRVRRDNLNLYLNFKSSKYNIFSFKSGWIYHRKEKEENIRVTVYLCPKIEKTSLPFRVEFYL